MRLRTIRHKDECINISAKTYNRRYIFYEGLRDVILRNMKGIITSVNTEYYTDYYYDFFNFLRSFQLQHNLLASSIYSFQTWTLILVFSRRYVHEYNAKANKKRNSYIFFEKAGISTTDARKETCFPFFMYAVFPSC